VDLANWLDERYRVPVSEADGTIRASGGDDRNVVAPDDDPPSNPDHPNERNA
jgi:endogenous inhibitor of DNA gyrase (YacG/DUF329 family)